MARTRLTFIRSIQPLCWQDLSVLKANHYGLLLVLDELKLEVTKMQYIIVGDQFVKITRIRNSKVGKYQTSQNMELQVREKLRGLGKIWNLPIT